MTTSITVHANAGHAVAVMTLSTGRDCVIGWGAIVEVGHDHTFHVYSGQDLLIHEVQDAPTTDAPTTDAPEAILHHFRWGHLLHELQAVSVPFGLLAARVVTTLPPGPERSVALRKLLEAKDAAVRAAMEGKP
jgi:hypothetical protein